jgi:predicted membrane protein
MPENVIAGLPLQPYAAAMAAMSAFLRRRPAQD